MAVNGKTVLLKVGVGMVGTAQAVLGPCLLVGGLA